MTLAERLISAREAAGIAEPAELARRVGLKKPSAIYQIEKGTTKSLKGPMLVKLSDALGVHPRWLMFGKPPRESQPVRATAPIIAATQEVLSTYLRIIGQPATLGRDPELLAATLTLVLDHNGPLDDAAKMEMVAQLAESARRNGGSEDGQRGIAEGGSRQT